MRCEEWERFSLQELVTPGRCIAYGIVQPGENTPKGIPIIKVNDIISGLYTTSKLSKTSSEIDGKYLRTKLHGGELVLTLVGSVGKCAIVPLSFSGCNTVRAVGVIPLSSTLLTKWMKHYLATNEAKEYIDNRLNTTVQATFKLKDLNRIPIPIPEKCIMENIVRCLDALDDKIERNNRINETLEEMAQAIFKSWFVNFEPFQDGEFVESELGMIPKGWRVARLSELCHSISKKHDFNNKELIFLNTGDIESGNFSHSNYMSVDIMPGQAKKSIQYGDILYSEIRPINRHFAFVNFEAGEYVVSTKLMVIRANSINKRRLYNYLASDSVIAELQMEAESRSGTFPQIRFENIQNLKMLIASHEVEVQYSELLERVYVLQDEHTAENIRLATIRDSLLPKLMSGEMRVPFEQ